MPKKKVPVLKAEAARIRAAAKPKPIYRNRYAAPLNFAFSGPRAARRRFEKHLESNAPDVQAMRYEGFRGGAFRFSVARFVPRAEEEVEAAKAANERVMREVFAPLIKKRLEELSMRPVTC